MEKEFEIPYKEGQFGVYHDLEDDRDFKFSEVPLGAAQVDWENKNFKIECPFKVKDQNGSLSCVGQTYSENEELLNWLETGSFNQFSAKDIYGAIYIANSGGAYLRAASDRLVNRGVNLESVVSSYENGKPPTEKFMRDYKDTDELKASAKQYKAKEYRSVRPDINEFARAIEAGGALAFGVDGENKGWQTADVIPPVHTSWGHAILGVSYGMRNGKKAIKFLNHWGEGWGDKGYGYLYEDYFVIAPYRGTMVYNGWTIIDQQNINNNIKPMRYVNIGVEQYLLDDTLKLALNIGDVSELEALQSKGLTGSPEEITIDSISDYEMYPLVRKSKLKDLLGL